MSHGELIAELAMVSFSSASVASHSMKGFLLKGDVAHFSLVLAKSNQSTGSIHGVNPEALPSINVIPWETISMIDNRKHKYFCWEKKMKTKVKGDHVMGWVRKEKKGIFSLSPLFLQNSLYIELVHEPIYLIWKKCESSQIHTHAETHRGMCVGVQNLNY